MTHEAGETLATLAHQVAALMAEAGDATDIAALAAAVEARMRAAIAAAADVAAEAEHQADVRKASGLRPGRPPDAANIDDRVLQSLAAAWPDIGRCTASAYPAKTLRGQFPAFASIALGELGRPHTIDATMRRARIALAGPAKNYPRALLSVKVSRDPATMEFERPEVSMTVSTRKRTTAAAPETPRYLFAPTAEQSKTLAALADAANLLREVRTSSSSLRAEVDAAITAREEAWEKYAERDGHAAVAARLGIAGGPPDEELNAAKLAFDAADEKAEKSRRRLDALPIVLAGIREKSAPTIEAAREAFEVATAAAREAAEHDLRECAQRITDARFLLAMITHEPVEFHLPSDPSAATEELIARIYQFEKPLRHAEQEALRV